MNSIFSEHIKELRNNMKMNQADFSKLIGTNQSTLSAYENGDRFPPYETLITIASKCNISLDWLCGLSEKKQSDETVVTYSDLINILLKLKDVNSVSIDFKLQSYSDSFNSYQTLLCEIDDKHIIEFYNEWKELLSIRKKSPSGEKLYDLWKKDIFERFNFPLEKASQTSFDLDRLFLEYPKKVPTD